MDTKTENEPQMDADFGLGFDCVFDERNTPSKNVSDFLVVVDSKNVICGPLKSAYICVNLRFVFRFSCLFAVNLCPMRLAGEISGPKRVASIAYPLRAAN
jgi:hypothetical protein